MADHPRSRGVYCVRADPKFSSSGSSPLARGLRHDTVGATGAGGIIPARAGFTLAHSIRRGVVPDHPRSRGVYAVVLDRPGCDEGSSPLARGLLLGARRVLCGVGIIPARAGFTFLPSTVRERVWDHPRSRGVYKNFLTHFGTWMGSSPLARGLRSAPHVEAPLVGIIPARAGFTSGFVIRPASG